MSGGSTNGVLHLLAIAREAGVPLEIDEFDAISERTPLLCDLQPGGRYAATDLYEAGGVPLVLKRMLEAGVLNGDAETVTGRTIGEHAAEAPETPGQRVVLPLSEAARTRPAGSRSCAGTSPRTAAWSSSPATPVAATPARPACSTARRRRWRRCSRARSGTATWS